MKTNLEIFNEVEQHLLKQNARSISYEEDTLICAYRGLNGLKCAVGCLIKDECFEEAYNTASVCNERVRSMLEKSGISINNKDTFYMLQELQQIHDKSNVAAWSALLVELRGDLINKDILAV